uniref:hypothetical protein n=1 Tax=Cupriavidus yeoncheonensis TaxID=1462994 RepID=UPI003F49636B
MDSPLSSRDPGDAGLRWWTALGAVHAGIGRKFMSRQRVAVLPLVRHVAKDFRAYEASQPALHFRNAQAGVFVELRACRWSELLQGCQQQLGTFP